MSQPLRLERLRQFIGALSGLLEQHPDEATLLAQGESFLRSLGAHSYQDL